MTAPYTFRLTALAASSLITLPLAGCVLVGVSCSPRFESRRVVKLERPHATGTGLHVSGVNGALRVVADPSRKDVDIEAVLLATGGTQEEADRRVEAAVLHAGRDQGGNLVVRAEFPAGGKGSDRASIRVLVPDARGVRLETTNGAITATGLGGKLVLRTVNGPVNVDGHGGDAILETTNGSVHLTDHGGKAQVSTTNGSVDVGLRKDVIGPVQVRTSNGAIRLHVGLAFGGTLSMSTSNGAVRVRDDGGHLRARDLEKRSGTVTFRNEGGESMLRASNGGITVQID